MLFHLHAAQPSANFITASAQCGIIGQHSAKRSHSVNISDGLVFTPGPQGMITDS
jgi:hypothetical protein